MCFFLHLINKQLSDWPTSSQVGPTSTNRANFVPGREKFVLILATAVNFTRSQSLPSFEFKLDLLLHGSFLFAFSLVVKSNNVEKMKMH